MNEKFRYLLDKANKVFWTGGNPKPIMKELNEIVKDLEKDERMRSYWKFWKWNKERFCLLNRQKVMGIVASLNEMTELFLCGDLPREIRTRRFLNSKTDILETLAKGVIHQSLSC